MNEMLPVAVGGTWTMSLAGDRTLVVERRPAQDEVRVVGPAGQVSLSLVFTADGVVLQFDGPLLLRANGTLGVSADRLALHAREELSLRSEGNLDINVAGDLRSVARVQEITADLGNVNLKANDDVKLNGERVLVNC